MNQFFFIATNKKNKEMERGKPQQPRLRENYVEEVSSFVASSNNFTSSNEYGNLDRAYPNLSMMECTSCGNGKKPLKSKKNT